MSDVVVVTEDRGGWAAGCARAFADQGDVVVVLGSDPGRLAALTEASATGTPVVVLRCDITDPDDLEQVVDRIETEHGPIAVWVNAARHPVPLPFDDLAPHDVRRATEVGYLSAVYGTMSAVERMRERDHGVVVHLVLDGDGTGVPAATAGVDLALRGFHASLIGELAADGCGVRSAVVGLSGSETVTDLSGVLTAAHPQSA